MLPVALLSRVTFTTTTFINRYCIDIYTHFSWLLSATAVRFAWGGKRPPEYKYPQQNQLIHSTSEPGKASPGRDATTTTAAAGARHRKQPYMQPAVQRSSCPIHDWITPTTRHRLPHAEHPNPSLLFMQNKCATRSRGLPPGIAISQQSWLNPCCCNRPGSHLLLSFPGHLQFRSGIR